MPDLSALVRLNSVGFLFLAYVILFIIVHGLRALAGGAPMAREKGVNREAHAR